MYKAIKISLKIRGENLKREDFRSDSSIFNELRD